MKSNGLTRLVWGVLPLLVLAGTAFRAVAKSETEWYDDGMALVGEKKLAEAEAAFREAIKVDPRYKEAWQALADTLKAEGKTDRAVLAQKMADESPAARAGDPPPLTEEQTRALGEVPAGAAAPAVQRPPATATTPPAAPAAQPAGPPKPLPALNARDAAGKPKRLVKLTQYDQSEYCDLAVGPSGTLHAVFTDRPEPSKPQYLYYRNSSDGGKTWTEPVNLSDDESGRSSSYARVLIDGQRRVYAIWKYVDKNELIDGPGGNANGALVYRCWSGGAWSRMVRLHDPKVPSNSWFVAIGPDGSAQVVWSQMAADAMAVQGWGSANYADLVQQAVLDGPSLGPVRAVIAPTPLPTTAQADAAQAAGHAFSYYDTMPKQQGLVNVRGYLDARGTPHFVAEDPGQWDKGDLKSGRRIVLWDGAKLQPLYEYEKNQTYNNFNNPPALLLDAQGLEHLIRAPEKAEKACVRDYPITDGQLGDPVSVLQAPDGKAIILRWQATQLPGGRMAVTVAYSAKGGFGADDVELFISFSDGDAWTKPLCVTDNVTRQSFAYKELRANAAVGVSKTYRPSLAAVAIAGDGHPCVLMVDNESSLSGITGVAAGGGLGTWSVRTDSPMVMFLKL